MSKRQLAFLLAVIFLSASLLGINQPVNASSTNNLQLLGVIATSCTPGDYVSLGLKWYIGTGDSAVHQWTLTNLRTGTKSVGTVTTSGPVFGSTSGYGLAAPAGSTNGDTFEVVVIVNKSSLGDIGSFARITFDCASGAVFSNVFMLNYPGDFEGPAIPAGYVLRTITCDVAVFDTPGGKPVADNAIKAGQTWFVSPSSTKDARGEAWSQVFVSSISDPWIPTRCIGPAPAGY